MINKFSDIKLPSNEKFGYFFTFVFLIITIYFYINGDLTLFYVFGLIALSIFFVSVFNPKILLPFNKLWMILGFLLSIIISPIVMGLIFFGIFTPLAILMRLVKRDELNLKYNNKKSYWINRSEPIKSDSFKNQF